MLLMILTVKKKLERFTKKIAKKEENNKEGHKLKVGDNIGISKYKNNFAKGHVPNWSEEVFVIKKVKNTVMWTYVINDFNSEEIVRTFYKKNCKNKSKTV